MHFVRHFEIGRKNVLAHQFVIGRVYNQLEHGILLVSFYRSLMSALHTALTDVASRALLSSAVAVTDISNGAGGWVLFFTWVHLRRGHDGRFHDSICVTGSGIDNLATAEDMKPDRTGLSPKRTAGFGKSRRTFEGCAGLRLSVKRPQMTATRPAIALHKRHFFIGFSLSRPVLALLTAR